MQHVPLPLSVAAGDLAVVTVAVGVAAVVTNVSSGSHAVANRSSIVAMADVSWPSTESELFKPEPPLLLPIEFVRTFIIAI